MRLLAGFATLGASALLCGCGVQASAPPDQEPTIEVPSLEDVSVDVPAAVRVTVPKVAAASARRLMKKLTVRVRNVSCQGVVVGSGFAVDRDLLITNRHVLAGAGVIEVSTWDGHSLDATAAEVGVLGDLGVALVSGTLPRVGSFGQTPSIGDPITVAGYPLGGELSLSKGAVVDFVDGAQLGIPGEVMRVSARIQHGNSGGPVLDRHGKIVGVVYAIEVATDLGLAIPIDTLRSLARSGGFESVPPCGSS